MDRLRDSGADTNKVMHTMLGISAVTAGVGIFICANINNPIAAVILLGGAMVPITLGECLLVYSFIIRRTKNCWYSL
ncbi:hypothetical protein PGS49_19450 [Yersinia intermedia]|uniref:hypothetical protein n=1 Tax=Yersinia intermedia TaxID=631 RepID=UPI0021BDA4A7|nr:hypothetical protein [Yersinia intermedia]MCW8113624.1 hypothetical protein [Yersinia intermedia]MDA5482806.1 hypothetical protein [Yersinia intermedia]MDA5518440.1 hypothetical protein [Yersinia intermedia]